MSISAKEVQELRKISGAGMMECKTALSEANGNIDNAFKLLREKGIAKAEKKSSRDANEGLIGVQIKDNHASIVEINSETDFVSRNSEFQKLVSDVLSLSMNNIGAEDKTISDAPKLINEAVAKIGENIVLKRVATMKGNLFSYMHNSIIDNMGKIGVLLSLECKNSDIDEIGKNLCMHIAASSPKSISNEDLDRSIVENEREIIKQQLKDSGKPENIVEKMMEGKMKKFYEENTLLGQKFVMDQSITIQQYISQCSKELGSDISVKEYLRFELGN
mgnify:CR=1 FL=1